MCVCAGVCEGLGKHWFKRESEHERVGVCMSVRYEERGIKSPQRSGE